MQHFESALEHSHQSKPQLVSRKVEQFVRTRFSRTGGEAQASKVRSYLDALNLFLRLAYRVDTYCWNDPYPKRANPFRSMFL